MYLGIDLGDKRTGIAVEINGVVIPKAIISRTSVVRELKKLIKEYDVEVIVVGIPYDLYGKEKKQQQKTLAFIEKLDDIFPDIRIESHDERYSSFEASIVLDTMGIQKQEGQKDDISAVLILESYLHKHNIIF